MRLVTILRMTFFLAEMNTTVKWAIANFAALKRANPGVHHIRSIG
jgi:hypothetical protein